METKFQDNFTSIRNWYISRKESNLWFGFFLFSIKSDEVKRLLGNVSEVHTPRINPNLRRIATPPPESYSLFDEFDLIEDQLLFSTTNAFNDKDAGKFFFE